LAICLYMMMMGVPMYSQPVDSRHPVAVSAQLRGVRNRHFDSDEHFSYVAMMQRQGGRPAMVKCLHKLWCAHRKNRHHFHLRDAWLDVMAGMLMIRVVQPDEVLTDAEVRRYCRDIDVGALSIVHDLSIQQRLMMLQQRL
jgi:hypothetical protein